MELVQDTHILLKPITSESVSRILVNTKQGTIHNISIT